MKTRYVPLPPHMRLPCKCGKPATHYRERQSEPEPVPSVGLAGSLDQGWTETRSECEAVCNDCRMKQSIDDACRAMERIDEILQELVTITGSDDAMRRRVNSLAAEAIACQRVVFGEGWPNGK